MVVTDVKKESEPLRSSLRNACYSEKTVDKIINWYTLPEKSKGTHSKH
jgi:hypothetical protein